MRFTCTRSVASRKSLTRVRNLEQTYIRRTEPLQVGHIFSLPLQTSVLETHRACYFPGRLSRSLPFCLSSSERSLSAGYHCSHSITVLRAQEHTHLVDVYDEVLRAHCRVIGRLLFSRSSSSWRPPGAAIRRRRYDRCYWERSATARNPSAQEHQAKPVDSIHLDSVAMATTVRE